MAEPAKKKATYADLCSVPENMTGEIIDGELYVTPRPSRKHAYTAGALGGEITPPYQFGRGGGPGGWIILPEPEIRLGGEHTVAPDLAGWKKERFPKEEPHNWISVVPDWVCEILSHGTVRKDRIVKMRKYALYHVQYAWLVDPLSMILEVFGLESGRWVLLDAFGEDDKVRAEPFAEIEINLSDLWLEALGEQPGAFEKKE